MLRRLSLLPGDSHERRDALFLLGLCLSQALVFWRTAPVFFDGDAFFYFAHPVANVQELVKAFTSVDVAGQYRPLGGLLVGYVFHPLFGLNYSLYSATALFAHLVNTVLVFFILRQLLKDSLAVYAGTLFWAFDPVAIYVTHSFSFLPDFSYAFFYLCALLAFIRHARTGSRRAFALVVVCFVLSLLSKELAITLPAVLILITLVFLRGDPDHELREQAARGLVRTLVLVLLAYLALYALLKGGDFYDSAPTANYFVRFDLQSLLGKIDYWLGALYLPLRESLPRDVAIEWQRRLVYLAAPLLLLLVLFMLWPPREMARRVRAGVLWSLLGAGPVLFLSPKEFSHNLYVPVVGLAVVVGLFWLWLSSFGRQTGWLRPGHLHAYGAAVLWLSLFVNQKIFAEGNWRPYWERVARTWVEETRRLVPSLGPPTQLYVLKSGESQSWNLYGGELLRVFYHEPHLRIGFDDEHAPLPLEAARRGQAFVLTMLGGHVHDLTATTVEGADSPGVSLVERFGRVQYSLISGRLPERMHFDTPSGKAVFTGPVRAGDDYRQALTMLGGTRVRLGVTVDDTGRLSFGVTKRFEKGDGVVARIYFDGSGGRRLLYERKLNPRDVPRDRRWFDETVDLAPFRSQAGFIELECSPGLRGDYLADWLAWSELRLEGAHPL